MLMKQHGHYGELSSDGIPNCEYAVAGCTDETACNYNEDANVDDESCYNNDLGCDCEHQQQQKDMTGAGTV